MRKIWILRCAAFAAAALLPISQSAALPGGPLCSAKYTQPVAGTDRRLLNHYPYDEAATADLVKVPAGFAAGSCALIHKDAAPHLTALIAAAKKDGVMVSGISCFRSIAYQRATFCKPDKLASQGGIVGRARSSAPPGYSEHATGYTLDFGDRAAPGANLDVRFANTKGGTWLAENAPRFGFELSFPKGNAQGVMFEPWHWRWVGTNQAVVDKNDAALKSRATFEQARKTHPGRGME
jgi:zinc D-Ala-D-Ala carboxypeptidase